MKQCRLEAEEGKDLRPDAGLDCPPAPVLEVRFELEMHESVAQWPRHREVNAAFGGGIAGRDQNPAVRQPIFSKRSIQNQLIAACLCHLRRRSQLVKEENALATFGQEF